MNNGNINDDNDESNDNDTFEACMELIVDDTPLASIATKLLLQ